MIQFSGVVALAGSLAVISLIGGVVLWILGRLCTKNGPSILLSMFGALLTEVLLLLFQSIPVIPFIVLYALLVIRGRMHGFPALVAVLCFMALRLLLVEGLLLVFVK